MSMPLKVVDNKAKIKMTNKIEAPILMTTNRMEMCNNNKTQMLKVMTRMKIKKEVEMISRNRNLLVKNVSTSFAVPRKSIKNSDPKFNMQNIDSCVDRAMKIIVTMIFVNSANRFTPVLEIPKMMTNGLVAINAIVG